MRIVLKIMMIVLFALLAMASIESGMFHTQVPTKIAEAQICKNLPRSRLVPNENDGFFVRYKCTQNRLPAFVQPETIAVISLDNHCPGRQMQTFSNGQLACSGDLFPKGRFF